MTAEDGGTGICHLCSKVNIRVVLVSYMPAGTAMKADMKICLGCIEKMTTAARKDTYHFNLGAYAAGRGQ